MFCCPHCPQFSPILNNIIKPQWVGCRILLTAVNNVGSKTYIVQCCFHQYRNKLFIFHCAKMQKSVDRTLTYLSQFTRSNFAEIITAFQSIVLAYLCLKTPLSPLLQLVTEIKRSVCFSPVSSFFGTRFDINF